MLRDDLSNKLTHLIQGEDIREAFGKFENILAERRLRGASGFVRGGFKCVCFTDTPIAKLAHVLSRPGTMKYQPLGVMVDKDWVSERGGRPAIYQPECEFEQLPSALRWRHVRFEPHKVTAVDFSWEREWRLHADGLALAPASTTIIVPSRDWRDALTEDHFEKMRSLIIERGVEAVAEIGPFPWHILVLEDLGVPIPHEL